MKIFDPLISGSLSVSSSAQVQGDLSVLGHIFGTSSFAITASYVDFDLLSGNLHITGLNGFNDFSSSIATTDLNQNNRLNSIESKTGSFATTGSNVFIGNQTISGNLNVTSSFSASGYYYPSPNPNLTGVEVMTMNGTLNSLELEIPKTIYERVKNVSGGTLVKGTPVHVVGISGFSSEIIGADASDPNKMPASFILYQDLTNEEEGLAVVLGDIKGIDTTGYIEGNPLYVRPGGGWTQTRPTGSALIQNLGFITKVGSNGGGVILNAGIINDLPNIPQNNIWIGNTNGAPITVNVNSLGFLDTGSFNTISGSFDTRINNLSSSLGTISSSLNTSINNVSSSLGSISSSLSTTITNVSTSFNTFSSSIDTTIKNKMNADQVVSGSVNDVRILLGINNVDNTADIDKPLSNPTKAYIDEVAQGLQSKPSVKVATTGNLTATYDNGTLGVGATLTSTTNGVLGTIDGISSWNVGDGILVKNQTNLAHNGRYVLTDIGSASTPWILTRCGLCDEASEIPGAYVFVQTGTLNEGTGWIQVVNNPDTFVVGTDSIFVFQFSGAGTYTAGNGIQLISTEFSVSGGLGLTQETNGLRLTNIAAGSTTQGALWYNGTTSSAGRLYGGTTNPTGTTRLNYAGNFHATGLFVAGTPVLTSEVDPKGVSSIQFTGTGTKTLTITLNDSTTVSNTFTDIDTVTSVRRENSDGTTGATTYRTGNIRLREGNNTTITEVSSGIFQFASSNETITLSGDVTGSGTTTISTTIANNAVTNAKFRQSAGFSVVGRSATGTGDVADIVASTDGVLRRSGTGNLLFGTLVTNNIGNSQVTYAKIQNVAADRILGRLSTAGVVQELTAANIRTFINSDGLYVAKSGDTMTGDLQLNNTNNRSIIFQLGAQLRSATGGFVISGGSGTGSRIILRPNGDTISTGQMAVNSTGTITVGAQATATTHAVRADRTLTLNGTTNQITVTPTGAQDLTSDRSWTLSLPQNINTTASPTFGGLTVNGSVSLRASSTASTATQIPVFIADPTSTTRTIVTRTPAQLRADIGAQATLTNPVTGTGTAGQVSFWTGTGVQSGDSGLVRQDNNKTLTLNDTVSSSWNAGLKIIGVGSGRFLKIQQDNISTEFSIIAHGGDTLLKLGTNGVERWRITNTGILQSNGAQTIQTSTGNLTLQTGAGNGHILMLPHGTGNVGINTTNPTSLFEVHGTLGQMFSVTNSLTGDLFSVSDISGVPLLNVNSSGLVDVDGDLHVTGEVKAYFASDIKLKSNIKPIENVYDKLMSINGYEFDWNGLSKLNKGHDIGIIAQEIEKVMPELVGEMFNGYKGVQYQKIVALLIETNKLAFKRIEQLEEKLKN